MRFLKNYPNTIEDESIDNEMIQNVEYNKSK